LITQIKDPHKYLVLASVESFSSIASLVADDGDSVGIGGARPAWVEKKERELEPDALLDIFL
jgi:hypothetical protein